MLVIRVELHSRATGKTTEIARMLLWNDGTGMGDKGNYKAKVVKGKTDGPMIPAAIYRQPALRSAEVKNYPRSRLYVWHLVARVLARMKYK